MVRRRVDRLCISTVRLANAFCVAGAAVVRSAAGAACAWCVARIDHSIVFLHESEGAIKRIIYGLVVRRLTKGLRDCARSRSKHRVEEPVPHDVSERKHVATAQHHTAESWSRGQHTGCVDGSSHRLLAYGMRCTAIHIAKLRTATMHTSVYSMEVHLVGLLTARQVCNGITA